MKNVLMKWLESLPDKKWEDKLDAIMLIHTHITLGSRTKEELVTSCNGHIAHITTPEYHQEEAGRLISEFGISEECINRDPVFLDRYWEYMGSRQAVMI